MSPLLGVAGPAGDGCTCDDIPAVKDGRLPPGTHRIDCPVEAASQPHAMINDAGEVFYPDGPVDARLFADEDGARPLDPGRFPTGWLP